MDIVSYLLGKNSAGGGGEVNLQEKSVTITQNTTTTVNPDSGYDGMTKVNVTTNVEPNLQDKQVTITENTTTTIQADSNYDGLGTVSVITNVSGGGAPTKGFTIDSWDNDGYPIAITTYGYTIIPNYMFYAYSGGSSCFINLQEVTLNNEVTTLNDNSFQYCSHLQTINNINNVTLIGANVFTSCSSLVLTKLPSVTEIGQSAFKTCVGIKKLSLESVVEIKNTSTGNGTFAACSGLKKVWIGSSVTTLGRYTFYNCSNIQNIYIDLPRATVEAMANYVYAFMNDSNKKALIVCNDDANFISLAEFDALVVN